MARKVFALVVIAALALTGSAVAGTVAKKPTTVTVTAGKPTELKFTLSKKSVAKGKVVFKITNRGALSHDFKIAGKKTKLIPSGKSAVLGIVFTKPGKYVYMCTVPGHAAAGMKGVLVVK